MKIQGSYPFAAPQDLVWTNVQNPEVLAAIMPGCEKLVETGENEYQGILKIRVGPVQGKFNGKIKLSDINAPQSYTITVDGKGAPGFIKGSGTLRLEADGDSTILHYDGDAHVGGRLASVGQRLLDSSAKAIVRQSLEGLGQHVQNQMMAQISAQSSGTNGSSTDAQPAPPPIEAPSQIEFATGVAKNMLEELLPLESRDEMIKKGMTVLGGLILFRILSEWWMNRMAKKIAKRIRK